MISIVMATYNGEKTLSLTLDAFCQLEIPDVGIEFIVVDNASTDNTSQLLARYVSRLPLHILYEPKSGRACALNRGIAHASGDLIIITDDDVLPDTNWLSAYATGAECFSEVGLFAGQVRHYWQKTPPEWMKQLAAEGLSYGGTQIDRIAGPIVPESIKGANFAARKHIFEIFQLNEELGYGANGVMVAGDESDFARRAVDAGNTIRFLPDARLRHIVRPHEVAVLPVLQRYFRIGRGIEAMNTSEFDRGLATLFGYPRYLFGSLSKDVVKVLGQAARGNSFEAMKKLIEVVTTIGKAYQWRLVRREQQAQE